MMVTTNFPHSVPKGPKSGRASLKTRKGRASLKTRKGRTSFKTRKGLVQGKYSFSNVTIYGNLVTIYGKFYLMKIYELDNIVNFICNLTF
jgi:hypothetical protein